MADHPRRWREYVVPVVLGCVALYGCGRDADSQRSDSGGPQTRAVQAKVVPPAGEADLGDDHPAGNRQPKARRRETEGPAAAIRAIRDDLAAGRGAALADRLPESWRAAFAHGMASWKASDPARRRAFLDSLADGADAVAAKAELIEASEPLLFEGPAAAVLDEHLASLAKVTASLARWPGWRGDQPGDLAGLIELVAQAVSAEKELADDLKRWEFETNAADGERATLKWRPNEKADWQALSIVQRDGIWLPLSLVERWERAASADEAHEAGGRLEAASKRLEMLTATLKGVKTQQEFDAVIDEFAGRMLEERAAISREPRPVTEQEFAWLVVSAELTDTEKNELLWNVAQRTAAPASAVADLRDGEEPGRVRIHVAPVTDLERFASRLTGLKIDQIDQKTRTIRARVLNSGW